MGGGLPSPTHSNAAGLYNGAVVNRSGPAESIRGGTKKKSEERKEWINGIEEIEQEHIIGRNISFVFKV